MANRVEIEETELHNFQQVSTAVRSMLGNPKARKLLLQAQKEIAPGMVIPEIDAPAELSTAISKAEQIALDAKQQMADFIAAQEAEKKTNAFASAWEGKKSALRQQGYTDEGITKIEALAQERGIPDLDAAAALFDRLNPPAPPATPNGFGTWDLFQPTEREGEDMKKLLESRGDDDMALRKLIDGTLTEMRGGARR